MFDWRGGHVMVRGGYGPLVAAMGTEVARLQHRNNSSNEPNGNSNNDAVRLGTEVVSIDWAANKSGSAAVTVRVRRTPTSTLTGKNASAAEFEDIAADAVLVTVPLGVLQAGALGFTPPLPAWKQGAIARLGFGLLNKVVLCFDSPFWQHKVDMFGVVWADSDSDSGANNKNSDQSVIGARQGRFFQFWNTSEPATATASTGTQQQQRHVLVALLAGDAAYYAPAAVAAMTSVDAHALAPYSTPATAARLSSLTAGGDSASVDADGARKGLVEDCLAVLRRIFDSDTDAGSARSQVKPLQLAVGSGAHGGSAVYNAKYDPAALTGTEATAVAAKKAATSHPVRLTSVAGATGISGAASVVPAPSHWHVTDWACDPYSRGTYSYIPPGASGDDYDVLAEPLRVATAPAAADNAADNGAAHSRVLARLQRLGVPVHCRANTNAAVTVSGDCEQGGAVSLTHALAPIPALAPLLVSADDCSATDSDAAAATAGRDVVFFAGEATYRYNPATVPGAFCSGLRAAGRIADALSHHNASAHSAGAVTLTRSAAVTAAHVTRDGFRAHCAAALAADQASAAARAAVSSAVDMVNAAVEAAEAAEAAAAAASGLAPPGGFKSAAMRRWLGDDSDVESDSASNDNNNNTRRSGINKLRKQQLQQQKQQQQQQQQSKLSAANRASAGGRVSGLSRFGRESSGAPTALSHPRRFAPLKVWLPSTIRSLASAAARTDSAEIEVRQRSTATLDRFQEAVAARKLQQQQIQQALSLNFDANNANTELDYSGSSTGANAALNADASNGQVEWSLFSNNANADAAANTAASSSSGVSAKVAATIAQMASAAENMQQLRIIGDASDSSSEDDDDADIMGLDFEAFLAAKAAKTRAKADRKADRKKNKSSGSSSSSISSSSKASSKASARDAKKDDADITHTSKKSKPASITPSSKGSGSSAAKAAAESNPVLAVASALLAAESYHTNGAYALTLPALEAARAALSALAPGSGLAPPPLTALALAPQAFSLSMWASSAPLPVKSASSAGAGSVSIESVATVSIAALLAAVTTTLATLGASHPSASALTALQSDAAALTAASVVPSPAASQTAARTDDASATKALLAAVKTVPLVAHVVPKSVDKILKDAPTNATVGAFWHWWSTPKQQGRVLALVFKYLKITRADALEDRALLAVTQMLAHFSPAAQSQTPSYGFNNSSSMSDSFGSGFLGTKPGFTATAPVVPVTTAAAAAAAAAASTAKAAHATVPAAASAVAATGGAAGGFFGPAAEAPPSGGFFSVPAASGSGGFFGVAASPMSAPAPAAAAAVAAPGPRPVYNGGSSSSGSFSGTSNSVGSGSGSGSSFDDKAEKEKRGPRGPAVYVPPPGPYSSLRVPAPAPAPAPATVSAATNSNFTTNAAASSGGSYSSLPLNSSSNNKPQQQQQQQQQQSSHSVNNDGARQSGRSNEPSWEEVTRVAHGGASSGDYRNDPSKHSSASASSQQQYVGYSNYADDGGGSSGDDDYFIGNSNANNNNNNNNNSSSSSVNAPLLAKGDQRSHAVSAPAAGTNPASASVNAASASAVTMSDNEFISMKPITVTNINTITTSANNMSTPAKNTVTVTVSTPNARASGTGGAHGLSAAHGHSAAQTPMGHRGGGFSTFDPRSPLASDRERFASDRERGGGGGGGFIDPRSPSHDRRDFPSDRRDFPSDRDNDRGQRFGDREARDRGRFDDRDRDREQQRDRERERDRAFDGPTRFGSYTDNKYGPAGSAVVSSGPASTASGAAAPARYAALSTQSSSISNNNSNDRYRPAVTGVDRLSAPHVIAHDHSVNIAGLAVPAAAAGPVPAAGTFMVTIGGRASNAGVTGTGGGLASSGPAVVGGSSVVAVGVDTTVSMRALPSSLSIGSSGSTVASNASIADNVSVINTAHSGKASTTGAAGFAPVAAPAAAAAAAVTVSKVQARGASTAATGPAFATQQQLWQSQSQSPGPSIELRALPATVPVARTFMSALSASVSATGAAGAGTHGTHGVHVTPAAAHVVHKHVTVVKKK